MEVPQGTHTVGSDDSAVAAAESDLGSLPHQIIAQPAGDEIPDQPIQTNGSTLESPSSISASTIPPVVHPSCENQTSRVVQLAEQPDPPTEMSILTAELESISIEIGRILDRVEAGHSIMILDPDDHHKIYILGADVKKGQVEFLALTSQEDFELFTIIPHNLVAVHNGLPQYIQQFMPFSLEELETREGEITGFTSEAKCELIVHSSQGNKYYGVTVAHAFLSDEQRIDLWDKDLAAVFAVEVKIARNREINWRLKNFPHRTAGECIFVTRSPLLRHCLFFDDEHQIQEDLAVFRISKLMLERQLSNNLGRLAVFKGGVYNMEYTVKGILPIRTLRDITDHVAGKKVLIAYAEGVVSLQPPRPPPRSVGNNRKLGLMLTFVIKTQYGLEPGHSGHMVYLVHKKYRHVYIAGMLTGKLNCSQLPDNIYTAALVGAGLEMHPNLNLKPQIDGLQGRTLQSLCRDLQ